MTIINFHIGGRSGRETGGGAGGQVFPTGVRNYEERGAQVGRENVRVEEKMVGT